MRRSILVTAVCVVACADVARAGPLSLLLPDDARAFGFDERLGAHLNGPLEIESLVNHPSALTRFGALPTIVELRGRGEYTFRQTRQTPRENTRVTSLGARVSLAGTLGKSGWRYALSGAPSEGESYLQSRADARVDGGFDTFTLGIGKRLNARESLGFIVGRQQVGLPLDTHSLNLGALLPAVSRFDGRFAETRTSVEWERGLDGSNQVRLRAGALFSDASLGVQSQSSGRAAALKVGTVGFDVGARWILASRAGREWALEASGDRRGDSAPLRLDDGTVFGDGSGRYEQGILSLYRRGSNARGAWAVGIEQFGGSGQLAFSADTGPLFPSNLLGGLGRATERADVRYRTTLLRVGEVRQLSDNLQLRGALAFGQVAASVRADGRAFVLTPVLGQGTTYSGKLGPQWSLIPGLGASFKTGRTRLSAQLSQFVPLPEHHKGGPPRPPAPGRTSAKAFGGTLASIAVEVGF